MEGDLARWFFVGLIFLILGGGMFVDMIIRILQRRQEILDRLESLEEFQAEYEEREARKAADLRRARRQILARERETQRARLRRHKERQALQSLKDDEFMSNIGEIIDGL